MICQQHGKDDGRSVKETKVSRENESQSRKRKSATNNCDNDQLTHLQVADIADGAVVRTIRLDVLALLAEPHAIVDRAVEYRQIRRQMLQQPRLFVGVFDLEELIEFLAGNFEGRRHHSDIREDGLVVGPDEEDKADVVEDDEEERFHPAVDVIHTKLYHVRIPGPETNFTVILIACQRRVTHYHRMIPLINSTGMTRKEKID
jgi:hypothetical protein